MKAMIKGLGIALLTAVLVFSLAGCKEPEETPPPPPPPPSLSVINKAEIIITAPVKGMPPDTTVSSEANNFTTLPVSWSPTDNPFKGGAVYIATVKLIAESGYTFTGLTSAAINGQNAEVTNNTGAEVTLKRTFPETDTKTVSNITVKTQPTKLTYTHDDTLNLAGLVVTLTHDDTTTEDVTAANFTNKNITTNIANGHKLSHSTHNEQTIMIVYGYLTCNTATLTVNKKTINISAIQGVTAPVTGGTPVTVINENDQYSGTVSWDGNPSAFAPVTQYTATITLTPKNDYTLQGVASNFFTVAGATPVSNSANSNTVTAVFPQTAAISINRPEIIITAPVKGVAPNITASSESNDFAIGSVSWSPTDNPFKGGTTYTASVTLTAAHGFTFNGLTTPTINGQTATVTSNTGAAVTLSYKFPATNDKTVSNITVKTQPTNLTYTHGDTLSLTGLVVTLTYDDTTTEDVTAANLTNKNITTVPSQGNHLTHSTDDGNPVTVSYGNLHATTANLTVNKKAINIPAIQGVVAPITGGIPVTVITENDQYTGTISWNGNPPAFAPITQYTATITITPKNDYTLQGVTANYFKVTGATTVSNSANSGTVTAVFPNTAAIVINIAAIQGVTAPVTGGTPVKNIDNDQYTGTVSWNGNPPAFAAVTQYTATITLTAKTGYTLQGVTSNFFTVAGATTVSHSANSGTVTAVFPATAATVIDISTVSGVTPPVTGAGRVTSITQTTQFTGTVSWTYGSSGTVLASNFAASTVYTATITLTARSGYTLIGVPANFFTVAGATSVSNAADLGVITAVFPATDATTATPTATPAGGTYTAIQTVTLSTTTVDAKIYYTTATGNNTPATPTSSSTLYSAPITINASTSLKAIAIKDYYNSSGILSASYTINAFSSPPTLTLTALDNGLKYTWTPSTPTAVTYDIYWKAGSNLSAAEVKTGTRIANATSGGTISGLTGGTAYSVLVTALKSPYPNIDSAVVTKTTLLCAAEPVISVQPQSGFHNTNATLTVTANSTDGGSLSYQWYKNISNSNSGGTAISGATSSSYTLALSGNYYVVVTNTIANNGDGGTKTAQTSSNFAAVNVETDTAIWAKSVSAGSDYSQFSATTVDSSGNIYAVGYVGNSSVTFGSGVSVVGNREDNAVLVKYDSSGTALWAKTVSGNSRSGFNAVALDSSGNIYAAGFQNGSGAYNYGNNVSAHGTNTYANIVLVKYDSNGTALWARSVSAGDNISQFYAVAVDPWGDVYAAGIQGLGSYTYGTITIQGGNGTSSSNAVLVKYSSSGTEQWAKTVSYSAGDLGGSYYSYFYAVATDSSGNIYAAGKQSGNGIYTYGTNVSAQAGNSSSYINADNVVLVQYYHNGTAQWARTVSGASSSSSFNALAVDPNGGVYAAGKQSGNGSFGSGVSLSDSVSGAILVKYNNKGDAQWAQKSSTGTSEFKAVSVDASSNNVYAVGSTYPDTVTFGANKTAQGNSSFNVLLVKFNSSGTALWARSVFSENNNKDSYFLGVAVNSSGVYAVGYQSGKGNFSYSTLAPTVVSGSSSNSNAVIVKYSRY